MKIKNIWYHFRKICIHKYWVAHYCFKYGLYWRGLMHDMSKFHPMEFWESVRYYQGTSSPIKASKKENGYSRAWQHHKGHNPHHYEYWVDYLDDGGKPIMMPYKYAVEMLCDYLGAARAYLGKDFTYEKEYEWWKNELEIHPNKMMNEYTRDFITHMLSTIAKYSEDKDVLDGLLLTKSYARVSYFASMNPYNKIEL